MGGIIFKKAVMESDFNKVYDIIDQLSQFDTHNAPYIQRKKFTIKAEGDLYIIEYRMMNNEKFKESKRKAFSEYGFQEEEF